MNGLAVNLIDIPRQDTSYMVLESLSKEKNSHKIFYSILVTEEAPFTMGRGHDCDVRISDISVSRYHTNIKY